MKTEILIVGGSLGGVAAALAALDSGRSVILTEEYDWLGGQLTSQAVPPDEHTWVEQFGVTASYRALRDGIRDYYRRHYPLTERARARVDLNPGAGHVSRLCHEPRVAVAVIEQMLAPYRGSGLLTVLQPFRPVACSVDGDRLSAVTLTDVADGTEVIIEAEYVLDATETGELLPLSGTEFVTGFESALVTGEPSAPEVAQPSNIQAVTYCFAIDQVDGDHTIDRPAGYQHWRTAAPPFWGDRLLSWTSPDPRTLQPALRQFTPNPDDDPLAVVADQRVEPGAGDLWTYRRIAARRNFVEGSYPSDITLVNWPMVDYLEGSVFDDPAAEQHLAGARELSLSVMYWMQTEAPRPDGGTGYPGLRLRGDITGSTTGLAQAPYIRESRRILGEYTVVEQDLSVAERGCAGAVQYPDSVGIGMYRIDLHPSTGGDNYLDVASSPFEIPLGALLPQRMENLIPACKNLATTHITNGCYRLHPVEWNIGEAAGQLAAYSLERGVRPRAVRAKSELLEEFQRRLVARGVELRWPEVAAY